MPIRLATCSVENHSCDALSTGEVELGVRRVKPALAANRAAVIRFVGMILAEQDDEWQDGRRYFRTESMDLIDAVIDHKEVETHVAELDLRDNVPACARSQQTRCPVAKSGTFSRGEGTAR
jgi:hypothetical protein